MLFLRVLVASGLLLLGYYVGREIGRTEPVREELRRERDRRAAAPHSPCTVTTTERVDP